MLLQLKCKRIDHFSDQDKEHKNALWYVTYGAFMGSAEQLSQYTYRVKCRVCKQVKLHFFSGVLFPLAC